MGSLLDKNSTSVRKRIAAHTFDDEEGDEYEGSKFGGFPEYFRRKKIKLQNLDAAIRKTAGDCPKIFGGIVVHVNGYTQPSLQDLHHLVVSHGGGFLQYLDGKTTVTHIVASSLTPKKALEFRRYRIVKPAWIVESVQEGRVLPWSRYRVLDEGVKQRVLSVDGNGMTSQLPAAQHGYREQTDASWYTSQVQHVVGRLHGESDLSSPLLSAVENTGGESSTGTSGVEDRATPQSSGDFEVTSSLENLLDHATLGRRHDTMISPEMTPTSKQGSRSPASCKTIKYVQPAEMLAISRIEKVPEYAPPSHPNTSELQPKIKTIEPTGQIPSTSTSNHPPQPVGISSPSTKAQTAEEHNAILLADPRMRKSSTANPDFIRQYYSESRLHHLSTWKADLKAKFQALASLKSASQRANRRVPGGRRYIMHVDFDSFFCAVSLKNAPEYRDKPAVVAHGSGTGSEIASCNYPARAYGIKNGMWMKKAWELCPNIKVLPYDFPAYEQVSSEFYEAIIDLGCVVQSVSVDEALVDISPPVLAAGGTDGVSTHETTLSREQAKADEMAESLRNAIYERTGCAVSIGIGGNILLAKVALRRAKPAGQHQIRPEDVLDFLADLDVQDLPGVAFSIGGKLQEASVKYVKDVRLLTKERLVSLLGPKTGEKIWDFARGIDRVEVGEQVVRKSVSAEVNWGIRFISQSEAEEFVQNLCGELQRRLLEQRVKGRHLTMKIMRKAADAPIDPPKNLGHGKCDTFNKSVVLGVATNDAVVIGREAISILRSYGFSPGELRGLGVQMTKLEAVKSDTLPDGSQRRITFTTAPPRFAKPLLEEVVEDPATPKKAPVHDHYHDETGLPGDDLIMTPTTTTIPSRREDSLEENVGDPGTPSKTRRITLRASAVQDDPIDESSPVKMPAAQVHPAMVIARANAADGSARKLNLHGSQFLSNKKTPLRSTQFLLPSQIDPDVLDELPPDLRSRLLAQTKRKPTLGFENALTLGQHETGTSKSVSRTGSVEADAEADAPDLYDASPRHPRVNSLIPSQLDPDVLDALPPDVRDEVLASYAAQDYRAGKQTLLPQSPRKNRVISAPLKRKLMTPPKKRGRGRPTRAETRIKLEKEAASTYTQSSFMAGKKVLPTAEEEKVDGGEDAVESLDASFLRALPEDVRQEVLAQHRQQQLARKGHLKTAPARKKPRAVADAPRHIQLAGLPARPTFTTANLHRLNDLRDMMSDWFRECEAEGPHMDDVGALARYLERVVVEERNLAKVVSLVRWLDWVTGDARVATWHEALTVIKRHVQDAVGERGLGILSL